MLEKNIRSGYYQRLLTVQDKKGISPTTAKGPLNPTELIKAPYVLEFWGVPDSCPGEFGEDEGMNHGKSEIIIYQTADGKIRIDARMENETVWLTQTQMAELFQRDQSVVSRHIKNVISEGELDGKSNMQFLHITNSDKPVTFYSLDLVLAVGYRVRSPRGTQFRQWATRILHEYLQKGFSMNDDFLKNMGGGLYWKELLERIRDIRASEKVMYRQILDLYATSLDYNATMPETQAFFKIVQNKLHYAVSGKTVSEIIFDRANAGLPFMGLTVFRGSRPVKSEVTVAKNYMTEKGELSPINRWNVVQVTLITGYFKVLRHKSPKP